MAAAQPQAAAACACATRYAAHAAALALTVTFPISWPAGMRVSVPTPVAAETSSPNCVCTAMVVHVA